MRKVSLLILVLFSSYASAEHKQLKARSETELFVSSQRIQGSAIERSLSAVYDTYMPSRKCWVAVAPESKQKHCLKINRIDEVKGENATRTFLLLSGTAIDDRGRSNGNHIASGYVGLFVLKHDGTTLHIIAAERMFPIDDWGTAPDTWEFVRIGAGAFSYGWKSRSYSGSQGISGELLHILAPRGDAITDLAAFPASSDDSGHCSDDSCPSTNLDSTITFDSSDSSSEIYPLLVTVTGKVQGKRISPRRYTIRYHEKEKRYLPPEEYLLPRFYSQPQPTGRSYSAIGDEHKEPIDLVLP